MAARRHARIGTSGWAYRHWRGRVYPDDLPDADRLAWYAQRFDTVEINNAFYKLPARATLRAWAASVPKRFVFAVKASRYTTHMRKLRDPRSSAGLFMRAVDALEDRLGPILFQLPPRWRFDPARLDDFLAGLSRDHRYAFEFRDRSWIVEEALEILHRHRAAFCIYELDGWLSPHHVTTDFVYVRLHGPDGPYRGEYGARRLLRWKHAIERWQAQGLHVHCYFDNDDRGYAAKDAAALAERVT